MTVISPEFSVIIPVYNRSEDLRRALQSLTTQIFKNFEVLVCDDGSNEPLENVLSEFTGLLNIRYFRLEHSGGPAKPRNLGIWEARAPRVCFLDSDDFWLPGKLIEVHRKQQFDVCYHRLAVQLNGRMTRKRIGFGIPSYCVPSLLEVGNPVPNSSLVVKTEIARKVGGQNTSSTVTSFEDYDFVLRLANVNASFFFVNNVLGVYTESNGISRFSSDKVDPYVELMTHWSNFHKIDLPSKVRRDVRFGEALEHLGKGRNQEAVKFLQESVILDQNYVNKVYTIFSFFKHYIFTNFKKLPRK